MASLAGVNRVAEASRIFTRLKRTSDAHILSATIALMLVGLVDSGHHDDAERIFKELSTNSTPLPGLVYEKMIAVRCARGDLRGALAILEMMRDGGVRVRNQDLVPFVDAALSHLRDGNVEGFNSMADIVVGHPGASGRHAVEKMIKIKSNTDAEGALSLMMTATKLLSFQPTAVMYHDIISSFVGMNNKLKANDLLMEMREKGLRPLDDTLALLKKKPTK
jgi:hypothetical protein